MAISVFCLTTQPLKLPYIFLIKVGNKDEEEGVQLFYDAHFRLGIGCVFVEA